MMSSANFSPNLNDVIQGAYLGITVPTFKNYKCPVVSEKFK